MAVCSVCLRSISLTAAGLIRVHGPVHQRYPGSGKPPKPNVSSWVLPGNVGAPDGPAYVLQVPRAADSGLSLLCNVPPVKLIDRIPSAARYQCGVKFTAILSDVIETNSLASWDRLLHFPSRCLRLPEDPNKSKSLSSKIKEQLVREESPPPQPIPPFKRSLSDPSPQSLNRRLSQHVSKNWSWRHPWGYQTGKCKRHLSRLWWWDLLCPSSQAPLSSPWLIHSSSSQLCWFFSPNL